MPKPTKPKAPSRRQRRHGDLPAGFLWREGRPRWVPSPTRRKQGWRAGDLKDARGAWLAEGAAIERARAIAQAVTAWAAGQPVPHTLTSHAPKGATAAGATAATLNPRSIGVLMDAYKQSPQFTGLARKTQSDYASKLNRFLEVLIGGADAAKIAALRAAAIDELLPPAFGEAGDFEIERAYDALRQDVGEAMAYGVLAAVSAWLAWCVKKKRVWATNPAQLVRRKTPDGRIEVLDWPEVVALVRAADKAGLPSIADAVVLGLDLSWSQQDLLALTWGQVSADNRVKHRRIKTGNAGNPPLLALGKARMGEIKARWVDQKVRPTHVIVCELTGKPWVADTFRHHFAEIRSAAAKAASLPALTFKQFRDLRDTSVTYCSEGGLTLEEICSRTLHAPEHAQAVLSKHYGAIRQQTADAAAVKLEAHFARMGYTLDPVLALPAPKAEGEG